MAIAFLLHPVLEHHGYTENKDEVNANDTKGGSEDLVKVPVGKGRELANASTLLRCNKGIGTSAILHEWRRSRVCVAATIKLGFVSI
jgi:hypothetical protein